MISWDCGRSVDVGSRRVAGRSSTMPRSDATVVCRPLCNRQGAGGGAGAQALSPGTPGAMVRGAEACAAMVARADSGWLKQQFGLTETVDIYEAIYRSLFVQTRGVLKKELTAQLRTRRQMRHTKGGKAKNGQGHIDRFIRERPAEEDRQKPAIGKETFLSKRHAHRDYCERHSRFTMLVKLPEDTTTVVAALAKHIRKLPERTTLSDVGSRQGDVWPQALHATNAGLFL